MSSYTYDTTVGKRIAFRMLGLLVCPVAAVFVGAVAAIATATGPVALIVMFAAGFYGTYALARLLKIDTRERAIVSVLSAAIACAEAVGLVLWILSQVDLG